jgi:transposase
MKRYHEQDPEQVMAYLEAIKDIPNERIAYVDETGIDTYLNREYGRSERGKPLIGRVRGRKFQRLGIVAARISKTTYEPLYYKGTMDSRFFEKWFETRLLSSLPDNTVIVMDNASFHRKVRLFELAAKAGHSLIFLPPYSPELNPIELFWGWLKRHLRKTLPDFYSLEDALRSAFMV